MPPKDLVAFLEPVADGSGRLEAAVALAHHWQAHLIGTFVRRPLALDPHAGFACGAAVGALLEQWERQGRAAADAARQRFDALTRNRRFTAEWRVSDDEDADTLMLHARHACLAVLGPPARSQQAPTPVGLAEQVLLGSGRPCLLLPEGDTWTLPPQRIVVGWNGSAEATRAIADAMPFLVEAERVVLVVAPAARMQSRPGEDPGADMATHLARQGVRVELQQSAGEDAGAVLLSRCATLRAQMLVMGAMARTGIGGWLYGGATRAVLRRAPLPLLLSR
jgi:nucleotide-binding universal stress UspA family protein